MSIIARSLAAALEFLRRSRDDHLNWQLLRQSDVAELRHANRLAEQDLIAELKKREQQLAHELAVLQTQNLNQLEMVKTQCQQDLKDYQDYLRSLDRLKVSLSNRYQHLPEAVAFTIHHHAKQLLNEMWEAEGQQQRLRLEMQLLQFMTAVHEDSQIALPGSDNAALPEKTLACIDAKALDQIG